MYSAGYVRGNTDRSRPPWLGKTVATCMSYLTTGDPGKEQGTNKLPPTGRIREGSKGERRHRSVCPTNLPESFSLWNPSWLSDACATRKGSESERLARDNPETNPIPIKPNISSHVAEQFSCVPLPSCSSPRCPFSIKSLALSACVSPRTIHFRVLDNSPLSSLGRGPPPTTDSLTRKRTRF